jgi:hypothetical protein
VVISLSLKYEKWSAREGSGLGCSKENFRYLDVVKSILSLNQLDLTEGDNAKVDLDLQRGPKVTSLAAGAHNISRLHGAHRTQILQCIRFRADARHIRESDANVACPAARGPQQGILRLDPSLCCIEQPGSRFSDLENSWTYSILYLISFLVLFQRDQSRSVVKSTSTLKN